MKAIMCPHIKLKSFTVVISVFIWLMIIITALYHYYGEVEWNCTLYLFGASFSPAICGDADAGLRPGPVRFLPVDASGLAVLREGLPEGASDPEPEARAAAHQQHGFPGGYGVLDGVGVGARACGAA